MVMWLTRALLPEGAQPATLLGGCPFGLAFTFYYLLLGEQAADVEADAEADGIESQVDAVVVAHGEIQEPGGAEGHTQVVAVVASEVGPARDEALGFKRAPAVTTGGGRVAGHPAGRLLAAPRWAAVRP